MKALRPLTASLMLLTSCLLISNTTLAKTTLKLSHNQDKSHAVHKALSYLADKTKEYSNGELVIRIYPNATLGNERESLELMNSGALQMVKVNTASLESFAPDYSLLAIGVPITFAIGLSSLLSIITALPPDAAISVISQKMTVGLDGFTLLAIPFFVLAGNIMNTGGIARRLVNLAQALVGRLPGSLAHCNILANTLFGAISGSAVASAAAVGGIMSPLQEKEGYDPAFSAAVNIASAPIGLMIPPSNVLIVYSLASGGTSVAALFLAGYLPGILTAVALMFVAVTIIRWPSALITVSFYRYSANQFLA